MKTTTLILYITFLIPASTFAQAGSAGFQILKFTYSARDLSLGNSSGAVTNEPSSLFTNPAGLSLDNKGAVNFMLTHRTYFGNTTIDMFGTRFETGNVALGIGLLLSSVPGLEVRIVPSDEPQSTFSAKDFAFAIGAAHNFDKIDIGISFMYLYEKLFVYESQGYAANFGFNYSIDKNFELGLSAGNLGSSSAMISEKIALPAFIRIGGRYSATLDDNFTGTGYVGVSIMKSSNLTPSVGAELSFRNFLNLRAGYSTGVSGINFSNGFSFGAGVSHSFLRFDYSYTPLKLDFGNSQTFTIKFIL
jgi:hypothetical protein